LFYQKLKLTTETKNVAANNAQQRAGRKQDNASAVLLARDTNLRPTATHAKRATKSKGKKNTRLSAKVAKNEYQHHLTSRFAQASVELRALNRLR
jgi:hypothetical protein